VLENMKKRTLLLLAMQRKVGHDIVESEFLSRIMKSDCE
jgi:hypothetical protein